MNAEREKALREFEAAHRNWMNTRISTPEGRQAKQEMNRARKAYIASQQQEPMKLKQPLTVDALNDIQCEWMSLQPWDKPDEVRRITKSLDAYPKCYVSLRPNKRGIVMDRGVPMTSEISLDDAFHYCALRLNSRTDIVWDGDKGAWRDAKEVV